MYSSSKYLLSLIFVLFFLSVPAQKKQDPVATDIAKTVPAPYGHQANRSYKKVSIKTYYVEMRDGVKLAVDVYKPKGMKAEKLPSLIHQTRYWRSAELRWPFKWMTKGLVGRQGKFIKDIVTNGYVVVNVDSRGSGASFGSRPHPWTEEETLDGVDIIEWILEQEWSDGNIGSLGVSYSGTTAEFLAFNQHPNLKAVILMYSLFDVYDDIAYPGGVFQKHFVNDWGLYNSRLDMDQIPRGGFPIRLLVKGVRRVRDGKRVRTFKAALRDHEANLQVNKTASGVEFRDQVPDGVGIDNMDVFSPFTYIDELDASGTAVYCYSGWLDGAYQHSNIRRYLNLTNPANKLILGPWEHSGKYNCSPAAPSLSGFDHVGEILKFMDYHLKGMDNGLDEEAPIHYFTMMEDEWKAADTWPPEAMDYKVYFESDQRLSEKRPASDGYDVYTIDTTVSTHNQSRWYSTIGKLETPNVAAFRKEETAKLLYYDSNPLEQATEITGHPIIHLYVDSDQSDGNFHVYLDEVTVDGSVINITEGLLRGIHRQLDDELVMYKDVVPYRNYTEANIEPMIPGTVSELIFDLLPVSYLVAAGSRLRISLAGADQTHFSVMHKAIPTWKVQRNEKHASYLEIPVVR